MEYNQDIENVYKSTKSLQSSDFKNFKEISSFVNYNNSLENIRSIIQGKVWRDGVKKIFLSSIPQIQKQVDNSKFFIENIVNPLSAKIDPLNSKIQEYKREVDSYNAGLNLLNNMNIGEKPELEYETKLDDNGFTQLVLDANGNKQATKLSIEKLDSWKEENYKKEELKKKLNDKKNNIDNLERECLNKINEIKSILQDSKTIENNTSSISSQ